LGKKGENMAQDIIMPKLGLTMTNGRITKWLKKEGDPVRIGEVVAEIETDKINAEVEATVSGYILKILAEEGEERDITVPICTVGEKNELVGEQSGIQEKINKTELPVRIKITPLAKKMAKENDLDYKVIQPTGPEGRIVKVDILAAIEKKKSIKIIPVEEKIEAAFPTNQVSVSQSTSPGILKKLPLEGVRAVIARRLTQSKQDIPHVYFKTTVDATNLIELKNKLSDVVKDKTGKKLTLNDVIIKAVAVTLSQFPDVNVSLVNNEIIYYGDVNIGMAVSVEKGLVVPVIRNADLKTISDISRTTSDLADKARNGKLSMDDMSGGTFTVSNLGAYGIDEFSAIINPPESAILAIGAAKETPVVEKGQIVVKAVIVLTLSVDHRVIDGALAAKFMKKLKEMLENPYGLLV
jgi:pyruvate dehydrogenase E2 component (dihydrolipoamide acetyltransferase)